MTYGLPSTSHRVHNASTRPFDETLLRRASSIILTWCFLTLKGGGGFMAFKFYFSEPCARPRGSAISESRSGTSAVATPENSVKGTTRSIRRIAPEGGLSATGCTPLPCPRPRQHCRRTIDENETPRLLFRHQGCSSRKRRRESRPYLKRFALLFSHHSSSKTKGLAPHATVTAVPNKR